MGKSTRKWGASLSRQEVFIPERMNAKLELTVALEKSV
jgi:hypothetical protein